MGSAQVIPFTTPSSPTWPVAGDVPDLQVIVHDQATTIAAQVLRLEGKVGTLVPGAYADLLVVDGDPLQDLSLLEDQGKHLSVIMKAGRFHKRRLH